MRQCQRCVKADKKCETFSRSEKYIRCQKRGEKCDLVITKKEIKRWLKFYKRLQARRREAVTLVRKIMQAAAAAAKEAKLIKYFIKALERRREKMLELKNQNIAELKINEALNNFNSDSVFCDSFLFSFFSLETSFSGETVNESSQVSSNSEDSQWIFTCF